MAESELSGLQVILSPHESAATYLPRRECIDHCAVMQHAKSEPATTDTRTAATAQHVTTGSTPATTCNTHMAPKRCIARRLFGLSLVYTTKDRSKGSEGIPASANGHDEVAPGDGDSEDALLYQAYQAHVNYTFYANQCDEQLMYSSK